MATKGRELSEVTPNSSHPNPLISHEKLRQLYGTMLKCRVLGERMRNLEMQAGFDSNYCSCVGLEATAVGAAIDLRPEDTAAPSHQDFILSYLRGVPLTAMFSQLYGRNTSPYSRQWASSGHRGYPPLNNIIPASTVVTHLKTSTDIALANQREENNNVVLVFSDEDSASLGVWHKALNFAGLRRLPIVFVHHNDLRAESALWKAESNEDDISPKTVGYGFPGISVDGSDAVAMYRVAQEAIERARSGGGPTLIEALTSRGYSHTEMYPEKYRAVDQVEEWTSTDPIAAMERSLMGKGLFSEEWKKVITDAFQRELDAAVEVAEIDRCRASA
jgi:TPP-dependent pyruvate/acetoin dehydrogenase alpha subunit